VVPLHRNRDFMLLQAGQLLSSLGTATTTIAYPLLALAITNSPALAGLVAFVRTLPMVILALPAGLAADRYNRKLLMIAADAIRVLTVGTLAGLLLAHHVTYAVLLAVGFVEGAGAAMFIAAEPGGLRSVVAPSQLPAASGAVTGREGAVMLGGPALGGVLFSIARAVPFLVDAASYLFSTVSLLLIRKPFQENLVRLDGSVWRRLTEGLRFLWQRPFLRTCALLFSLGNFIIPGLLLAVVVVGARQGLSGAAVGALVAAFGGALFIGSFLSPLTRRLLPVRAVLLLELWSYLAVVCFVIWPNVYVLAASLLPCALAIPSTDSVVHGYRIAMTPDRLIGRVESARKMVSMLISPLGPLVAGVLLSASSERVSVGVFLAVAVVLAAWGSLSPAIRTAPSLDDLTIVV
jgi:Transmembrane secretion effector